MKNTLFFLGLFLTSVYVFSAADKESLPTEKHSSAEVSFMAREYAHVYGGLPTDNFVKPQPKVFFSDRTGGIERVEIQDLPDGHEIKLKDGEVAKIKRSVDKGENLMEISAGATHAFLFQDKDGKWHSCGGIWYISRS
ncbi:hypothetical protein EBQ93_00210 [bacterium]|nr:hypothetical protein [bacterium]